MKKESRREILERREEIKKELMNMLKETKSDFKIEDVLEIIYLEEGNDDMMNIVSIFDRGGDISEMNDILELVTDAWNYFPHKALEGLSPAEKILEQ